MSTRLETARLVIRAFEARDTDAWIAMFNDPKVTRFIPGQAPTLETFHMELGKRHAMEAQLGCAIWAVDEKSTGMFIGQCGLRPAATMDPGAGSEIDLAYDLASASWSKGYATEVVIAVLARALTAVGLEGVMAVAFPENVGSWRVVEKERMRYEGTASYCGLEGLKKYTAERDWWKPPVGPRTRHNTGPLGNPDNVAGIGAGWRSCFLLRRSVPRHRSRNPAAAA